MNDVPYAFSYIRELMPAWLDAVVTLGGFEPPSREDGLTWCELGCGQGVSAAVMAGTHPRSVSHAIDAMPEHVDYARRLCDAANISNLTVHALDFASALDADLPRFDYVVAHGVYSWIDARAREDLRRLVDKTLKPGGVFYVSYNAMPGWASDSPFQFLVRALAEQGDGDSIARVGTAIERVQTLQTAGSPALKASDMATKGRERLGGSRQLPYLAHELLPPAWQPRYVTEVRREMAAIGLSPAGSATICDNFDSFVLRAAERRALDDIADPNLRELVRDYFMHQRFRRDVFVRDAWRLAPDEQRLRLAAMTFDLCRPPRDVEYAMETEAGRVDFDTRGARAIVDGLASGPARLSGIRADGVAQADMLTNALALFAANQIRVVEPTTADVRALNRVLLSRLDGPDALSIVALPVGTATDLPSEVLSLLAQPSDRSTELGAWGEYLARYGSGFLES